MQKRVNKDREVFWGVETCKLKGGNINFLGGREVIGFLGTKCSTYSVYLLVLYP